MHLLAATSAGLFRTPLPPFDDGVERVLPHATRRLREGPEGGVYAATESGVSHATGESDWTEWTDCDLAADARDVLPLGDALYVAGSTATPTIFRRDDASGEWTEHPVADVSDTDSSPTDSSRDGARINALAGHPDAPDRLVVGLERGGVAVSDDRGETWRDVSGDLRVDDPEAPERSDDVHRLVSVGPDHWLAATGGGVYRTRDAGDHWARLHTGDRPYARSVFVNDGRLYASLNRSSPGEPSDGTDAAIYVGDVASDDPGVAEVGERFAVSFASAGPTVLAGCADGTILSGPGFDAAGQLPVSDATAEASGVADLLLRL
ncbi:hypothetical protein SAMN04487949_1759 [Halogranum gelatinilyticum]|uniref:BNR/Asp-box repeat-containing protein n=1 Tax=Halogranum gelatinilyticum TaxID=660521 RepID=A0A1G9TFZ7_9EURY|nr:hypothetical protein [Halogranum gelatinilyticum]SDM46656.1 hypothetical protein SAMN04487949_1759 [Halogranum gelatinilyticum]